MPCPLYCRAPGAAPGWQGPWSQRAAWWWSSWWRSAPSPASTWAGPGSGTPRSPPTSSCSRWAVIGGQWVTWPLCSPLIGAVRLPVRGRPERRAGHPGATGPHRAGQPPAAAEASGGEDQTRPRPGHRRPEAGTPHHPALVRPGRRERRVQQICCSTLTQDFVSQTQYKPKYF